MEGGRFPFRSVDLAARHGLLLHHLVLSVAEVGAHAADANAQSDEQHPDHETPTQNVGEYDDGRNEVAVVNAKLHSVEHGGDEGVRRRDGDREEEEEAHHRHPLRHEHRPAHAVVDALAEGELVEVEGEGELHNHQPEKHIEPRVVIGDDDHHRREEELSQSLEHLCQHEPLLIVPVQEHELVPLLLRHQVLCDDGGVVGGEASSFGGREESFHRHVARGEARHTCGDGVAEGGRCFVFFVVGLGPCRLLEFREKSLFDSFLSRRRIEFSESAEQRPHLLHRAGRCSKSNSSFVQNVDKEHGESEDVDEHRREGEKSHGPPLRVATLERIIVLEVR
mmetsp:Transcript_37072/g.80257  ORF Transcript_37072/g.80257 Transcript_37072/m.80257 type:complete len:336 (+) Transcript_37072:613-1620(+)